MGARRVVETLSALRDMGPADARSVSSLEMTEGDYAPATSQHAVAEQLLADLLEVLSSVTSPAGAQSIVRRAINLAEVDCPFL